MTGKHATFLETCSKSRRRSHSHFVRGHPRRRTPRLTATRPIQSFEVLDGKLEVLLDRQVHTLGVGGKAHVHANTLHRFRNATAEPARFLVEFHPAGFEKFLEALFGLAGDGHKRQPCCHRRGDRPEPRPAAPSDLLARFSVDTLS